MPTGLGIGATRVVVGLTAGIVGMRVVMVAAVREHVPGRLRGRFSASSL